MSNDIFIKQFFSKMNCCKCNSAYDDDAVTLLRDENNYTVLRVNCQACGKNIGMAIVGISSNEFADQIDTKENEQNAIGYNEVIEAHNFFSNLGNDWHRHLPDMNA